MEGEGRVRDNASLLAAVSKLAIIILLLHTLNASIDDAF